MITFNPDTNTDIFNFGCKDRKNKIKIEERRLVSEYGKYIFIKK